MLVYVQQCFSVKKKSDWKLSSLFSLNVFVFTNSGTWYHFFGGGFYFNVKYTVLEKIQLECYIFGVMNIIILDESTSKIDNF